MININDIEKKLKFIVNVNDSTVFKSLKTGETSSLPIFYTFDSRTDAVVFSEIYNSKKIIEKTLSYKQKALRDDMPILPEKSFIFGSDIGGDPIIYDSVTGKVLFVCDITDFEPVVILDSIVSLPSLLQEIKEKLNEDDDPTTTLSEVDISQIIKSLNIVNNQKIRDFLLSLDIGVISSEDFKYLIHDNCYTSFLHCTYNKDLIIKKNASLKSNPTYNDFLIFAESGGGFPIALNLMNYSIYLMEIEISCIFDDIPSFIRFLKK